MPLNETELRKEAFEPGAPVKLADGQSWHLPKPKVRFVHSDGDAGFAVRVALGDGYQALLDAAQNAQAGPEVIRSELALGRHLLIHNYNLSNEQVSELLQFGYGDDADPEAVEIREAVMAVALGQGPKPSGGGEESPG